MSLEMNRRGYGDIQRDEGRCYRYAIFLSLAAALLAIIITIIVVLNVVLPPSNHGDRKNRTGTYQEYYSIPHWYKGTTPRTNVARDFSDTLPQQTTPSPTTNMDRGMFNDNMYMGDMMGMDDKSEMAYNSPEMRWPGGIIPYEMDSALKCPQSDECRVIHEAMEEYHQKTCIRFVPATRHDKYKVRIVKDNKRSCWSFVGFQRQKYMDLGYQVVNLGNGCYFKGTVVHELGHTVGFWHEQNRNDRDDWIKIHWKNVHPNHVKNFKLIDKSKFPIIDNFDYRSVMMYGETAFSVDGSSLTIEPLKEKIKLIPTYNKDGLSKQDIERIAFMYNC